MTNIDLIQAVWVPFWKSLKVNLTSRGDFVAKEIAMEATQFLSDSLCLLQLEPLKWAPCAALVEWEFMLWCKLPSVLSKGTLQYHGLAYNSTSISYLVILLENPINLATFYFL